MHNFGTSNVFWFMFLPLLYTPLNQVTSINSSCGFWEFAQLWPCQESSSETTTIQKGISTKNGCDKSVDKLRGVYLDKKALVSVGANNAFDAMFKMLTLMAVVITTCLFQSSYSYRDVDAVFDIDAVVCRLFSDGTSFYSQPAGRRSSLCSHTWEHVPDCNHCCHWRFHSDVEQSRWRF